MRSSAKLACGLAFALLPALAAAQSNLGDLLDAGAKKLSAEDFKRDVVQRTIVGRTNTGAPLELMYAASGAISGSGGNPLDTATSYRQNVPISGEWTIGEGGRICTAMQISPSQGGVTILPPRCQFWFRLGESFYISDSDSDRRASVLRRSVKSAAAPVATPSYLGQLLDAGARKLSATDFRRDIAQRSLVGLTPSGGSSEIMYLANGSLQGVESGGYSAPLSMSIVPFSGEWRIGESEKICVAIRYMPSYGATRVMPTQCQVWFKLGDDYFIADSESDRHARVLRRTIKP